MPTARILAIGDELILGRTCDGNSCWLAGRLTDAGLRPDRLAAVGDAEAGIVAAMRAAARGADLVICTGGLGPTDDDRTRHALARAAGLPLVPRPAAWRAIRRWYARNRPGVAVPAVNRRQALFPRGARLLPNDRGTAPGLLCRVGRAWVACLPGVPHEMRAMFARLEPQLPRLVAGVRPPAVGEAWIAGIGESQAQEELGDLLSEDRPMVGITVSELAHITLRAVGAPAEVRARLARIRQRLRPWLLPRPGLAASLVAYLTAQGGTIACAESCTAGHATAQIAAVPGASAVLRRSVVAYAAAEKTRLLGVPARLIARHGVVSEAVALAMAAGLRRASGATLAIATTGLAGPGAGGTGLPVGTVWTAAATAAGTLARQVRIGGDRERVQRRGAAEALLTGWLALTQRASVLSLSP